MNGFFSYTRRERIESLKAMKATGSLSFTVLQPLYPFWHFITKQNLKLDIVILNLTVDGGYTFAWFTFLYISIYSNI